MFQLQQRLFYGRGMQTYSSIGATDLQYFTLVSSSERRRSNYLNILPRSKVDRTDSFRYTVYRRTNLKAQQCSIIFTCEAFVISIIIQGGPYKILNLKSIKKKRLDIFQRSNIYLEGCFMKFIWGKQFRTNDHHGWVYSSLSDPPNFGVLSRWFQALWQ